MYSDSVDFICSRDVVIGMKRMYLLIDTTAQNLLLSTTTSSAGEIAPISLTNWGRF